MSIFDTTDKVESPATWRCPRCHTVQAETTRCWRCSQPAHTCATCRRYRPSVAEGLGGCTRDPSGTLVAAGESRSCWESAATAGPSDRTSAAEGLFAGLEPGPPLTTAATPAPMTPSLRSDPDRATRRARPSRPSPEDPGRAAWAERDEDRLVDAPAVEPGKHLTTEVERRRRRWFR